MELWVTKLWLDLFVCCYELLIACGWFAKIYNLYRWRIGCGLGRAVCDSFVALFFFQHVYTGSQSRRVNCVCHWPSFTWRCSTHDPPWSSSCHGSGRHRGQHHSSWNRWLLKVSVQQEKKKLFQVKIDKNLKCTWVVHPEMANTRLCLLIHTKTLVTVSQCWVSRLVIGWLKKQRYKTLAKCGLDGPEGGGGGDWVILSVVIKRTVIHFYFGADLISVISAQAFFK